MCQVWPCVFSDRLLQAKPSIITCVHLEKLKTDTIKLMNQRGDTIVNVFNCDKFFHKFQRWILPYKWRPNGSLERNQFVRLKSEQTPTQFQHKYPSTNGALVINSVGSDLEGKNTTTKTHFFIFSGGCWTSMYLVRASVQKLSCACLVPWEFSSFFSNRGRGLAQLVQPWSWLRGPVSHSQILRCVLNSCSLLPHHICSLHNVARGQPMASG